MMIEKRLIDISKNISSGITPLRSNGEFWANGTIPWLKTEQLGEKYIFDTNEYITEKALQEANVKLFPENTLSIAMYGEGKTRGNVSILKRPMATNQACCNIELDSEKVSPEYVYYFLKTQYENLRGLSSGIRKNLNTNAIKNFVIRLPENLKTQQSIAAVLSALDKKIALNKQINARLEQMAKTLYDYWFVQFDFPDANGKPYKSSGGEMVFDETLKREIPKGWEVKKIENILTIGSGFPFNSKDYTDRGKYQIVTIKNVQDTHLDLTKTDRIDKIPNNMKEFCILKKGDVLISLTGNIGRICFVDRDNLLLNQRVGKMICSNKYLHFFYLLFNRNESKERLEKLANGSSQSNLSPIEAVKDLFICPSNIVLEKFNAKVDLLFKKLLLNQQQNYHLIQLREFLLPMLMNGQVSVAE